MIKKFPLTWLVASFFAFQLVACSSEPNPQELETPKLPQKEKHLVVFMDYDPANPKANDALINEQILGMLRNACEKKEYIHQKYTMSLYPLYRETGSGNLICKYTCEGQIANGDLTCDDRFKEIRKAVYSNFIPFHKRNAQTSSVFKIMDSVDPLSLLCKNNNWKNKELIIVYLSDMLELHFPEDPIKGQFAFKGLGTKQINSYSLDEARGQLLDPNSYVGMKIAALKNSLPDNMNSKVIICPTGRSDVQSDSGANYSDILKFWTTFFQESGLEVQVLSSHNDLFVHIFGEN